MIEYKEKALKVLDKYPRSQGKTLCKGNPYVWINEIGKELNIKVSYKNGLRFEEIIRNDTNDGFYSFILLNKKWEVGKVYKFFKNNLYHKDKLFLFIPKVFDGTITSIGKLDNLIHEFYKISDNNFIYLMGLKDDYDTILKDKRIGRTKDKQQRLNNVNDIENDYPFFIALWNIPSGKERLLENFLHRKFKHIRKKRKRDHYSDPEHLLFNKMDTSIKEYLGNDYLTPILETD